jgi:hypothetical protein
MRGDSYLAGWRVRSSFLIDSFSPWIGEDRPPDVAVNSGELPEHSGSLLFDGPLLRISGDRSCRYIAPTGGAFFVNPCGTEVTVRVGDLEDELSSLLLRPMLAILCHKRRLLPIHASCVQIGGRAVAFAGPSAAGKSVLAAAFLQAGFPLLADDLIAVDPFAPGGPIVLPTFPQLKLWRDSLEGLGFDLANYRRCRPALDKYEIRFAPNLLTPLPLAAIYHLRRDRKAEGAWIQPLRGSRGLQTTADAICYGESQGILAGEDAPLQSVTALVTAVPAYTLVFRPGFDFISATVATVCARHGES